MSKTMEGEALCVTNSHGRLLSANRRFCRMFGIAAEEVVWRYIIDFHRNDDDWESFRQIMERQGSVSAYMVRMRHRKGRSFSCLVQSVRVLDAEGFVRFETTIQKVEAGSSLVRTIPGSGTEWAGSLVYLTVCHACGKVKDAQGHWVDPMRPVGMRGLRNANYCPECSAHLFPGLLDSQNWESSAVAR